MKKVLSLLMALIIVFSAVQCLSVVSFAAYDESGIFQYDYENGTVVITGISDEAEGTVTVPSEIDGDTVTAIGYGAFAECVGITKAVIPSTVKVIGNYAFQDCTGLMEVELNGTKEIGFRAFENCEKLRQITIPKTVISASSSFYNSGLETIVFERGMTVIPDSVCADAINLKSVTIPQGVTAIDDEAFAGCSSLEAINIPEGVLSIGYGTFGGCSSLLGISFPSSLISVGNYAFRDCRKLATVDFSTVQELGFRAFENCVKLKQASLPATLKEASRPFYNSGLETVTFEEGITAVPDLTCAEAKALKNVTIPDTVTAIGDEAFCECVSLETIAVPEGVTSIGYGAFGDCTSLTSFVFPETLVSVGNYAFHNCGELATVDFSNVQELGFRAFENCMKLKTVVLPETLNETDRPFYNSGLETVTFEDGTQTVPSYAFAQAFVLKSVTLPQSVTEIGSNAFEDCENMEEIVLPQGLMIISSYAFDGCAKLKRINIPDTVIGIQSNSFNGCDQLAQVTVVKNTTGWKYFENKAVSLTEIPCSHPYNEDDMQQDATCTEGGYTYGLYCPYCEIWVEGHDVIPATGHIASDPVIENEATATCTEGGSYDSVIYCSVCRAELSRNKVNTDKLGHSFTNYFVDENATCTEDGTKTAKCDRCNVTDTIADNGSAHGHIAADAVKENEIAATCTEGGSYDSVVYCSACQAELSRNKVNTDKLGHSFTNHVADGNATCTEDGTKTAKCDRCNVTDTIADPGSAHGHIAASAVKENVVTATCTANGSYESVVYCEICHEELSRTKATTDKIAHKIVTIKATPATCTKTGLTEGKKCSVCGEILEVQKVVSKKAHSYTTTTTKATTSKDGKIVTACTACGKVAKTVVIAKASTVTLSAISYTYDGQVKTPSVTVKNSRGTALKNGTDYTVAYASGRKNPGQYAVKVTFKGNYSGSKMLYFTILPGVTSKIVTTTSASAVKLTWKAVPGATGYRVYVYNTSTKKYTALKTTTATSYTAAKLKSGTKYKFAVKAYSTVNGKVYWASGYKTITATTNPGKPTLQVVPDKGKALLYCTEPHANGYEIYMKSGNTYKKIATLKTQYKDNGIQSSGVSTISINGVDVSFSANTKEYIKTGLTKGTTYYFKARAYKVVDGKVVYGDFSSVKSVKVK